MTPSRAAAPPLSRQRHRRVPGRRETAAHRLPSSSSTRTRSPGCIDDDSSPKARPRPRPTLLQAPRSPRRRRRRVMRLEVVPTTPPHRSLSHSHYVDFGIYRASYDDDSDALRMAAPWSRAYSRSPGGCRTTDPRFDLRSGGPDDRDQGARQAAPRPPLRAPPVARVDHDLHDLGRAAPARTVWRWRRRGTARVELSSTTRGPFLDTVHHPEKKAYIHLVHEDFLGELKRSQVRVRFHPLSADG